MTQKEARIIALRMLGNEALPTADAIDFTKYTMLEIDKIQRQLELIGDTLITKADKLEKSLAIKKNNN